MPREQINYPQTRELPTVATFNELPPGVTVSGTVRTETEAALHVSWQRDASHVQIALEVDVRYAQLAADRPDEDGGARTTLWTPVLSRQDINKLIRALRRARDTAYGADA